jgi:hypothetical protein
MVKVVEYVTAQRCESFYIGSCQVQDLKDCYQCRQNIMKQQVPRTHVRD